MSNPASSQKMLMGDTSTQDAQYQLVSACFRNLQRTLSRLTLFATNWHLAQSKVGQDRHGLPLWQTLSESDCWHRPRQYRHPHLSMQPATLNRFQTQAVRKRRPSIRSLTSDVDIDASLNQKLHGPQTSRTNCIEECWLALFVLKARDPRQLPIILSRLPRAPPDTRSAVCAMACSLARLPCSRIAPRFKSEAICRVK